MSKAIKIDPRPGDYTGMKKGHILVGDLIATNGGSQEIYDCLCECGNHVNMSRCELGNGSKNLSCGCVPLECRKVSTLCWKCNNSVPVVKDGKYITGCSWMLRGKPVKGWTAEQSILNRIGKTYTVVSCPEFIPYIRSKKMHETLEENDI